MDPLFTLLKDHSAEFLAYKFNCLDCGTRLELITQFQVEKGGIRWGLIPVCKACGKKHAPWEEGCVR